MTDTATTSATRTLTVQLAAWNEARDVTDHRTGHSYREAYARGSIELADPVHVVVFHDGDRQIVGRALPDTFRDNGTGPQVDVMIAAGSSAGADAMALVDSRVLRDVSMEMEPVDPAPGEELRYRSDQVLTRNRVKVHGISLELRPAHSAPILEIRSLPNPMEEPTMSIIDQPDAGQPDQVGTDDGTTSVNADLMHRAGADAATTAAIAPTVTVGTPSPELLERSVEDAVRRQLVELRPADGPQPGPASQYRSAEELFMAVHDPKYNPDTLAHRALADQISANNPGVMTPHYLEQIVGIIQRASPSVTAWGRAATPGEGKVVDWPVLDQALDLTTLVGEQLAELDPITSVQVDIKDDTTPVRTFAGGSRISYQLLRKSRPSYREAYLRIMAIAYGLATNGAMIADVEASNVVTGASTHVPFNWSTGSGEDLRAAIFEASTMCQSATGVPAQFAVASTANFIACAKFADVFPRQYGTQNVTGEFDATQLAVSIAGVPVYHDPQAAATSFKVSNNVAATWHEEGPLPAQSEDVEHLGSNVAIWGMGCAAIQIPTGIIAVETATPV